MKKLESIKEFGGFLERYTHNSNCCNCEMTFSIYLPPQSRVKNVATLYWLSGLTCTDDNFRTKAGAQRYAAEVGLALVIPDTSPRGENIPDFPDRYDLGKGAGFYVNSTTETWSKNYQMYDYIVKELPQLIEDNFPVIKGLKSISGHSMGGHGALICALKNPDSYRSVSAFSPICNPSINSWGVDCFSTYLGNNQQDWENYDTTCLVKNGASKPMLIDQGLADEFLKEQLYPQNLVNACKDKGVPLDLRMQNGYDHSYHFIASFIGEHINYHHKYLM